MQSINPYFFQAKRLSAKLHVIMASLPARPVFVFHRNDTPVGMKFHNIPPALQPKLV